MDVPAYIDQLRTDGARLADVASSIEPVAPVPTCPDWQLRDLVRHVGGVHRWATGFVSGAGVQPPDGDLERLVGGWPDDAELVSWFRDGHRALVEALVAAPAELEAWTFLDAPSPLMFWARRQAHETAIHRVDAESAAGDVAGFPSTFAADGVDELLLGFVSRPGKAIPVEGARSMLVCASDVARTWGVTFTPGGFEIQTDPVDLQAELVVSGGASDLYTLLWNRRDPVASELDGDPGLLTIWRATVRIGWT